MTVRFLIKILQTKKPNAEVRLAYYDEELGHYRSLTIADIEEEDDGTVALCAWTVLSSVNSSRPRSRKVFFHNPTEFGWMPYCLAIWPGVFSPLSTSRTTWKFSFGEYRFLVMTVASSRRSLDRSVPQVRRRLTPQ